MMSDGFSIQEFVAAAHRCAIEMMNNALYMRREMATVDFPPDIDEALAAACESLHEAKLEIVSELYELNKPGVASRAIPTLETPIRRVLDHLDEAAIFLDPLVVSLRDAAAKDSQFRLAYILVAESAVNVLNAHQSIPRLQET